MRGTLVTATTALIAALTLGVSAPALADGADIADPKGDVYLSAPRVSDYKPAGSVVNTDLLRTKVRHGKSVVRVVLSYQRLAAKRSKFISYDAELRVPGGDIFHGLVVVDPSLTSAYVNVADDDYVVDEDCTSGTVKINLKKDRLVVRIPRACLGNPRWIRFGGTALSIAKGRKERSYLDNALSAGGTVTQRLFVG